MQPYLMANWPAAPTVQALTTTRVGGHSSTPFDGNNFGLHVGDEITCVLSNRQALKDLLALPNEPIWLNQTHSNHCILAEEDDIRTADAIVTRQTHHPLAILTADCLPIVLCNQAGTEIAAVHAGWRGLVNGIIENTLAKILSTPDTLMAWIGPAICQKCYEVGPEVKQNYIQQYPFTESAFQEQGTSQYANLPHMAELILRSHGVQAVYQSNACSFEQEHHFYSYRRQSQTGRMTTLIWIN
jgi:YfiH family protein